MYLSTSKVSLAGHVPAGNTACDERGILMTINDMASLQMGRYNIYTHQTNALKNLRNLVSGLQINSAADNAAGLAVSEGMRNQITGLGKAYENTMQNISMIQTAEGDLAGTSDILARMEELAVQSANATYTDEDRALIAQEFDTLLGEIDRVSATSNYNGTNLLDGSLSSFRMQIGANNGSDQRLSFKIGDMSTNGLGLKDTNISTLEGAKTALETIKGAVETLNTQRSSLGASQNRLETTARGLSSSILNLSEAESAIRDADMAEEMMNYTQNTILQLASQSMLAQSMNLSQQNMLALIMR
jgi:flagellin